MRQVQTHAHEETDALPRLFAAARWRRRLLDRDRWRLTPDAQAEERVLLDCCAWMLAAILNCFDVAPDGAGTCTPSRQELERLLAAMQATSDAVQRAHAAGVEWTAIEGITQRAWPLASELFQAIGWTEAFRASPDRSDQSSGMRHASIEPVMMGAWRGERVDVATLGVRNRGLRVVAGEPDACRS